MLGNGFAIYAARGCPNSTIVNERDVRLYAGRGKRYPSE